MKKREANKRLSVNRYTAKTTFDSNLLLVMTPISLLLYKSHPILHRHFQFLFSSSPFHTHIMLITGFVYLFIILYNFIFTISLPLSPLQLDLHPIFTSISSLPSHHRHFLSSPFSIFILLPFLLSAVCHHFFFSFSSFSSKSFFIHHLSQEIPSSESTYGTNGFLCTPSTFSTPFLHHLYGSILLSIQQPLVFLTKRWNGRG